MALFTSKREKQLWLYACLVLFAILSTLAFGRPLQEMLRDQNTQAAFFLVGMFLTGVTIILHGLKVRPGKTELITWIGLAAVYIMFLFRLGAPERSHLIEYSVLAIFIHRALVERFGKGTCTLMVALLSFVITLIIGVIDESIQIILPERVFDPVDMVFNGFAAFMALASFLLLQWVKKKTRKES
jgi:uncharacterized membrane protein